MKILYKILIMGFVYLGSFFFFAGNISDDTIIKEMEFTDMSDATLPVLSFRTEGYEFNRLHGYCSSTDEMLIRESITPLTNEQTLTLVLDEGAYNIKKINYEVLDVQTGEKAEEGSIIAFDKEEDHKTAKLKIREPLKENTEFVLKITLISNESKRIYYYTRIIVTSNSNFTEKLQFVEELHTDLFTKNTENNFKKYFEYKAGTDNTSFARANIYSSEDMVSFGTMDPSMVYQEIPIITEYTKDTASVVNEYYIAADTETGREYYRVKDYYRFGYTSVRVYLYNFEREMESVFMPELASLSRSEFKIGVTEEYDMEFHTNESKKVMAFVRERELWVYDAGSNILTKVFSFKQENTDYIRDVYDQHDIRVMNVDEEGNINFMVYGYMNRGEYEGRVGIIIYRYNHQFLCIEEKAYIPMNTTYQILKEELGSVAFYNDLNVAYFTIFDTFYSYNFVSKVFTVLAENVDDHSIIYSEEGKYAVWHEGDEAEELTILRLDTGSRETIKAGRDEYIRVVTTVEDDFMYGLVKKKDVGTTIIGEKICPIYKIFLCSPEPKILREYSEEGYYVTSAETSENKITLYRIKKSQETYSGYTEAPMDYMLNSRKDVENSYKVTQRITDKMLKEYYIALPSLYIMNELPKVQTVKHSVISEDTTLRITKPDHYKGNCYVYSFGRLVLSSYVAGEAVAEADKTVGSVIDHNGKVIWQRGGKGNKAEIQGITPVYAGNGLDSQQAVLKMVFQYKGLDVDTSSLSRQSKSILEWIEQYLKVPALNLSGASLDEVLYMVYKNKPVIGILDDKAVLIVEYDSYSVTIINPSKGRTEKLSLSEAEALFSMSGNIFISYND